MGEKMNFRDEVGGEEAEMVHVLHTRYSTAPPEAREGGNQ